MTLTGLVLALGLAWCGSQDGLDRAIELMRSGDARAALAAAEAEADDLRRAQARVYVRHHAGDLEGALAAAEAGSGAHPDDPWLAERAAAIALSLRRAGAALAALGRLERIAAALAEPERTRWLDAARAARSEAEAVALAHARRDTAGRSARVVSLGVAGLALVGLLALALFPWHGPRGAPAD